MKARSGECTKVAAEGERLEVGTSRVRTDISETGGRGQRTYPRTSTVKETPHTSVCR